LNGRSNFISLVGQAVEFTLLGLAIHWKNMDTKPFVWQMIKEAVEILGGQATYSEIKGYIKNKYGEVNESTITAQTIVCTVNHTSRIHYPENKKPRIANSRYDFLFTTGRGQVTLYDPAKQGTWEIREDHGTLIVSQKDIGELPEEIEDDEPDEENLAFPFESHLRDFIAKNIESIKVNGKRLKLYSDQTGRDGVEYPTDVGFIDI
jgi:hypothetical protein